MKELWPLEDSTKIQNSSKFDPGSWAGNFPPKPGRSTWGSGRPTPREVDLGDDLSPDLGDFSSCDVF